MGPGSKPTRPGPARHFQTRDPPAFSPLPLGLKPSGQLGLNYWALRHFHPGLSLISLEGLRVPRRWRGSHVVGKRSWTQVAAMWAGLSWNPHCKVAELHRTDGTHGKARVSLLPRAAESSP